MLNGIAVLISPAIRLVLDRSLQCGYFVPRSAAEVVAMRELEARRWMSPAVHAGAWRLTGEGERHARAVMAG